MTAAEPTSTPDGGARNDPPTMVHRTPGTPMSEIFQKLKITDSSAVVLLIAGAQANDDPAQNDELRLMLRKGLVPVLSGNQILTIDGGTASGVLGLVDGLRARKDEGIRLGVAPLSRVVVPADGVILDGPMDQSEQKPDPHTLGPSHTHFLFTTGNEFGDETEALFEAADYAVERFNAPVVVVVIGGGGIARRELDYVLRRKWTVVALQDTRKLADQVARLTRPRGIWRGRRQVARASIWIARRLGVLAPEHIDRWVRTRLSTRLREQTVETHAVNGRADELLDMLSWYLDAEPTMVWAWSLFDKLDRAAVVRQKRYFNLLAVSLVLGVASTAAAISTAYERSGTVRDFLNWTLVILPALAAMTTTLVGRLAQDRQWVALRSGSEQIQREIFRYRGGTYANDVKAPTICDAHPHILAQAQRSDLNRIEQNELLAHRLQLVEQALVERLIEVAPFGSSSRTRPSRAPRETFSKSEELRQDVYVKRRLDDQLDYFAKRATKMQRQLTTWIAIPPVLAVGAAILLYKQQSPWTVIIAVGITAVSAWYQTKAIRESLAQGGEAVIKLKRIRGYWLASRQGGLPLAGPNGTAGVATEEMPLSLLVEKTEAVLERENVGWTGALEALIRESMRPEYQR